MRTHFWNGAASPADGGLSLMTTYFGIHPQSRTTELSNRPPRFRVLRTKRNSVLEPNNILQIRMDIATAAWTHMGRSTVGFVRTRDSAPSSLGSGTLIKFGTIVGVLTCAHVLEALLKEDEVGILC